MHFLGFEKVFFKGFWDFHSVCATGDSGTAVQLVFNLFSQLVPQLELYSQLQLSLWSDPIAFSVPRPT